MEFDLSKYSETLAALENLQNALRCHGCQLSESWLPDVKEKELFSLGICEHRFCRSCVETNKKSQCPVCSMPFRSTNLHVDKQLSNVVALCFRFSSILAAKAEEPDAEALSETHEASSLKIAHSENGKVFSETSITEALDDTISCGLRRSGRLTPLKAYPSKRENRSTPKTTPQGRKRVKDPTPTRSDGVQIKPSSDKTKTRRRNTHGDGKVTSDNVQNVLKNATANHIESLQTEFPISSSPRSTRNKVADKKLSKLDFENKEDQNNKDTTVPELSSPLTSAGKKSSRHLPVQEVSKCLGKMGTSSPVEKRNVAQQRPSNNKDKDIPSNLEKRNAKGETRLQVAAVKADYHKVQELLAEGANPNVKDNAGWTPLHEAVIHGNAKIAEILLDHGASVNAPGLENDTPLHDAVSNYNMECVKLLVERGANIVARNTHGLTPIDIAKTEDVREALLLSEKSAIAPEEDSFMEEDICKGVRLCFVSSSLTKEEMLSAQKCSKLLNAKMVENHSIEVTHSIHGVNAEGLCQRTLKYLKAILCGTWIINTDWLSECLQHNERVGEDDFEIAGCITSGPCNAPQRARLNRMKKLPGLFDGCQFYFYGKFHYPTPSKEELTNIAKTGGGAILTREPRLYNLDDYPYTVPYHAASSSSLSDCAIFVIYDDSCPNPPQVKSQRMSFLPASWLLDSVAAFALLEKTVYLKC